MRLILQRVLGASLKFNGEVLAAIGQGLVVLLTFNKGDDKLDAEWMAQKALRARLWHNPKSGKKWDTNAIQNKFEVLIVNQPMYAAESVTEQPLEDAKMEESLYQAFVAKAQKTHVIEKVKCGVYGKQASIDLMGDGPVTLLLNSGTSDSSEDSEDKKDKKPKKAKK